MAKKMRTAHTYIWTWILYIAVLTVATSTACQGSRSNSLSDNFYEQKLFKFLWVLHKCGPGLIWNQTLCRCARPNIPPNSSECPDRPPILTTSADRSPSTPFPGVTPGYRTIYFPGSSQSVPGYRTRHFTGPTPSGPGYRTIYFPGPTQSIPPGHRTRVFPGVTPSGPGHRTGYVPGVTPSGPGHRTRYFPGVTPSGPGHRTRYFPGVTPSGPGHRTRYFPGVTPSGPGHRTRYFPGVTPSGPGHRTRYFPGVTPSGSGHRTRYFPGATPSGSRQRTILFPGATPSGSRRRTILYPGATPSGQGQRTRYYPGATPSGQGQRTRYFPGATPSGQGQRTRYIPGATPSGQRERTRYFPDATASGPGYGTRNTSLPEGLPGKYPFTFPRNGGIACSQYRPNADNKLKFDHKDAGGKWQPQQCAPGTRWSQRLCTCVFIQAKDNISPGIIKSVYCEVLLLLPFDGEILDMSPSNSYIGHTSAIKVSEDGAFLDGVTSFFIPFFNGNFMGTVFLVQFSFKSASKEMVESPNKVMTLLSNGCENNPPSLHLSYTTGRQTLILEIATVFESLQSLACPAHMDDDGWTHVSLEFCPMSYAIFVNGQMCTRSPLKGSLDITNCDLVFGENLYTNRTTFPTVPFTGFLDNVNITRGCACINQPMMPFDIEHLIV